MSTREGRDDRTDTVLELYVAYSRTVTALPSLSAPSVPRPQASVPFSQELGRRVILVFADENFAHRVPILRIALWGRTLDRDGEKGFEQLR